MLIDSHCHLGHIDDATDLTLLKADEAGVSSVIDVGMGLAGSAEALDRARRFPGRVHASVGLHPNDLRDLDDPRALTTLEDLARSAEVVAVGETGLDFYRDREQPSRQEESFAAHIALARAVAKPLVIHCRDSHRRLLEVLDSEGAPDRVIMHCFSGDAEHARACAERGFYCSFAGNITYKRNVELRDAARVLPAELLLVETDAPYLAPVPHRGKANSPALLPLTAHALAKARDTDPEQLASLLVGNTRRAFGL